MIKSFIKYSGVALSLVIITTHASHATFFLNKNNDHEKDKPKISIFEPIKKVIDIKKNIISLPKYTHNPKPTPHIPNPPMIHTPHTPSTSVSDHLLCLQH